MKLLPRCVDERAKTILSTWCQAGRAISRSLTSPRNSGGTGPNAEAGSALTLSLPFSVKALSKTVLHSFMKSGQSHLPIHCLSLEARM